MSDEIKTLEQLIEIGNEGAPQEWLDNLTGEGVGGGLEGVDDGKIGEILANLPDLERAIQADYETSFHACNPANHTKGRGGNQITHIVVHYTAGAQTAEGAARANCIYFGRERVGASAHYFVDDGYTIWQSVPEEDTAWHAGNWAVNQRSIGIEVCTAGAFTCTEIERLTWLVRRLMDNYRIPASRVIRHYDVTGKHCPAHYVDAARWADLHARLAGGAATQPPANTTAQPSGGPGFAGGAYRCNVSALNVRDRPSLSGAVVASYSRGQTVNLDSWYTVADGYVWGRYTAYSGKTRYVAVGKATGKPEPHDYLVKA